MINASHQLLPVRRRSAQCIGGHVNERWAAHTHRVSSPASHRRAFHSPESSWNHSTRQDPTLSSVRSTGPLGNDVVSDADTNC